MTIASSEVTGLILAGGLGRRVGGADKGLLLLRGRPLVSHVADRLAPQVGTLLVSANRNPQDYARLGWPVVADLLPDHPGPLAGLHAGLTACATPWLVAVPCDAPLLPPDLVARLAKAIDDRPGASAAVPFAAGRLQPAFVLCRKDTFADLAAFLADGGRRMADWLRRQEAVEVPFPEAAAFANINTPEELAAVEAG